MTSPAPALPHAPAARWLLVAAMVGGVLCSGCSSRCQAGSEGYARQRARMVARQIKARGVADPRVLRAMGRVERHRFVPAARRAQAYADRPLPIGHGQTISQPYIVAFMSEALETKPHHRILEIGTGSGYQAAVLARLVKHVYSIEIVRPLGERARETLGALGYDNVTVRIGDGYAGWAEHAPFDGVILTAAPPKVPAPLIEQLKVGGHLVAPVGADGFQRLIRITRTKTGIKREHLMAVRFVPMTGKARKPDRTGPGD